MAQIISVSVNLSKIDKSKIVEGKNGAKYYNMNIIVNDDFDQYNNNVQVTDSQTKQQREAKEKRNFIGNGRVIWSNLADVKKDAPQQDNNNGYNGSPSDDDLPF